MAFLEIDNLHYRYDETTALDNLSLSVDRGSICALVGPDGAGKTTLIRLLCRLIAPQTGTVSIDGEDLFDVATPLTDRLGYMPQSFSLYTDLSVEENLRFYAGVFGLTGSAYIEKRDYLYTFSRLGPFAKRRAGALSGGMKQKLALSCALLHDPELLILDEPTTGVDPVSRRQFWAILDDLRRAGVTIFVSTPYMDEASRADRITCLFSGQRLATGTADEVAATFIGSILRIDGVADADRLARLDALAGVTAQRFGAGVHLYLPSDMSADEVMPRVVELGIPRSAITERTPSVEDRFIQLMSGAGESEADNV